MPTTVREQRFSRHAQVQTVLKYDDNRQRLPSTDERLDIKIDLGRTSAARERYLGVTEKQKQNAISALDF